MTTWLSQYQKGKTNLDFTEARDSEWQWYQLDPRVARFSTTKYGRFLSVDPSKSSPPNVSIYNSMHVAIQTQIPHKQ